MNALPPRFKVILTNASKAKYELQYELRDSEAAHIWFECAKKAMVSGGIKETRFYDFPGRGENYLNELLKKIEKVIQLLSVQFPELLKEKIDSSSMESLQSCMNLLHRNFAHNHLVEARVTQENLESWHQFNSLIHSIENEINGAKHPVAPDKINRSRIEFNWYEPYEKPIPDSCYNEFTMQRSFGDLQIIYCDVGRHLLELFHAEDTEIPLEHIRPYRHFSANAGLHFGYDISESKEQIFLERIGTWFKKHEQKFNQAGVYWDKPDRALGFVCAAKLLDAPQTIAEKKEFQKILAQYTDVFELRLK